MFLKAEYETNTVDSATLALVSIFTPNLCKRSIPRMISGSIRVGTTKKDTVVIASFHYNGSLAVLPSTKKGCVLNCYHLSLILNQRSYFHVIPSVPPLTTT